MPDPMTVTRTGDVEPRTAGQQRADWWHARMAEDPLLGPCGGTHALGYATCQRIAAIEQDAGREARRLALAEVKKLADEWEHTADLIGERMFKGDPSAVMAQQATLRNCAAAVLALIESLAAPGKSLKGNKG